MGAGKIARQGKRALSILLGKDNSLVLHCPESDRLRARWGLLPGIYGLGQKVHELPVGGARLFDVLFRHLTYLRRYFKSRFVCHGVPSLSTGSCAPFAPNRHSVMHFGESARKKERDYSAASARVLRPARYFSASSAAMQPSPAAVTAWR